MLKNVNQKYYCSNYYDVIVNKYRVKCDAQLRFWENNDSYSWFRWYFRYWLGIRSVDSKRQIARWKGIVSRFKGKLVKRSKMLMVDLMIILFHLKLDKFYYTGDMN